MKPVLFNIRTAQTVLNKVITTFAPCTVYVFGYRSCNASQKSQFTKDKTEDLSFQHYDLLVLSPKALPNGASSVAGSFNVATDKRITITILLHTLSDLATKQASQQCFFDTVMRHGYRLCLDSSKPPYILDNTIPSRDITADWNYWLKCEAVAAFHISAAEQNCLVELELCQIALLHTAVEYTALGLIRIGMGYTPKEYGLDYLLAICLHFTTLPEQLFPKKTTEDLQRYKKICAPPAMLRHWQHLNAAENDVILLLHAAKQWLQQSAFLAISIYESLQEQKKNNL